MKLTTKIMITLFVCGLVLLASFFTCVRVFSSSDVEDVTLAISRERSVIELPGAPQAIEMYVTSDHRFKDMVDGMYPLVVTEDSTLSHPTLAVASNLVQYVTSEYNAEERSLQITLHAPDKSLITPAHDEDFSSLSPAEFLERMPSGYTMTLSVPRGSLKEFFLNGSSNNDVIFTGFNGGSLRVASVNAMMSFVGNRFGELDVTNCRVVNLFGNSIRALKVNTALCDHLLGERKNRVDSLSLYGSNEDFHLRNLTPRTMTVTPSPDATIVLNSQTVYKCN